MLVSKVKELRRIFFYCWQLFTSYERCAIHFQVKSNSHFSLTRIKRKWADVSQQKEAEKLTPPDSDDDDDDELSHPFRVRQFFFIFSLLLWPDFGAMGSTRVDFDVRRRLRAECTSGGRSRHDGCRTCCVETFSREWGRKWAVHFFLQSKHELERMKCSWTSVFNYMSLNWMIEQQHTHTQQIVGSKSLSLGMGTTSVFFILRRKKCTVFSLFAVLRCTRSIFTKFNYSARKNWKSIKQQKFVCSAASSARRVNELEQFNAVFEKLIITTTKKMLVEF